MATVCASLVARVVVERETGERARKIESEASWHLPQILWLPELAEENMGGKGEEYCTRETRGSHGIYISEHVLTFPSYNTLLDYQ